MSKLVLNYLNIYYLAMRLPKQICVPICNIMNIDNFVLYN